MMKKRPAGEYRETLQILEHITTTNIADGETTEYRELFTTPAAVRQNKPAAVRREKTLNEGYEPDYLADCWNDERINTGQWARWRGKLLNILSVQRDYANETMRLEMALTEETNAA